jgi:hypothetical protein
VSLHHRRSSRTDPTAKVLASRGAIFMATGTAMGLIGAVGATAYQLKGFDKPCRGRAAIAMSESDWNPAADKCIMNRPIKQPGSVTWAERADNSEVHLKYSHLQAPSRAESSRAGIRCARRTRSLGSALR